MPERDSSANSAAITGKTRGQSKYDRGGGIVAKKWDPGILDPSRFSGQIRKVEARLGNLAKIRKVETD